MKMHKGFKFKLYPDSNQEQQLLQCGGNARFVWNYFLKQNMEYYKETKKFMFFYDLEMKLPELKKEYSFLKESFAQSLQFVARKFDIALKESFKSKKGFPKFKKKLLLNDSFTYPQCWKLGKGSVFIPKIGWIKWKKSRNLQGKPKCITVSQDGNQWHCSVLCEYEIKDRKKKTDNIVGIDVGIKEFATISDKTVIHNQKITKNFENKLTKEQRKLSRKQNGSRNKFKQRLRVRKIQNKIKNIRKDFLHKITSHIIAKYDGVVLENLNIKGMIKNRHLAKSISDVSWAEFKRQLEYKSKWNFKHFIQIDRFAPTSKTCSQCGFIQDMPLQKRIYNCPECGNRMDRDLNASINIRNLGLRILGITTVGQTGCNACGDERLLSSMKQEKECLENQIETSQNAGRNANV